MRPFVLGSAYIYPPPLARTKPSRACAARTMAAIDGMRARDAALPFKSLSPSAVRMMAAQLARQRKTRELSLGAVNRIQSYVLV